ncbi:MAG TPA: DUF5995 family protein [Puia sp.]|nr:DUF5995 family protein [Puia sp.]
MEATTIEEVLARLTGIIEDSLRTGDRTGYFAALYYKVTDKVREGIAKNEFEDGARMATLDVLFANRYLTALDTWRAGGKPTASWQSAFEACKRGSALVLQHLLLGINAHINLDLGIAAVETMKGQDLAGIEKDFDSINTIIGSLTYQVINEINHISPLVSILGWQSGNTESVLVQFSISNARDGAWCFAEDLHKLTGADYDACIAGRDKDIAQLANTLVHLRGTLWFTVWLIHLFEWKDVRRIVRELREYKRTFIHVAGH